jgi:hypothetical protein
MDKEIMIHLCNEMLLNYKNINSNYAERKKTENGFLSVWFYLHKNLENVN